MEVQKLEKNVRSIYHYLMNELFPSSAILLNVASVVQCALFDRFEITLQKLPSYFIRTGQICCFLRAFHVISNVLHIFSLHEPPQCTTADVAEKAFKYTILDVSCLKYTSRSKKAYSGEKRSSCTSSAEGYFWRLIQRYLAVVKTRRHTT